MTNEDLSQALKALADEFGAECEESTSVHDDTYREYTIRTTTARLLVITRRDYATWQTAISAVVQTPSAAEERSGTLGIGFADIILAWLRAKLLELTREEREARLNGLLNELLGLQMDFIAEVEAPSEFGLAERLESSIEEKRAQIRKLAFGGE